MDALSAEVLWEMFTYLTLDDLPHIHLVCRSWHNIAIDRRFRRRILNQFLKQYMTQLARTSKPETTISNELLLNADGTIKAATVEALISECIHRRLPKQEVLETLVMTWPCLSKQSLIERFLQRYIKATTDDEKYHVTGLILRIAALDTRDLARAHSRRVVQVLIQLHRLALEPPSQRLVPQLAFAWHEEDAKLLASLDKYAPRRRNPEAPASPPRSPPRAPQRTFLQLLMDERGVRTLAEQLTLRGWRAYDAISPHDLLLSRSRPQTITNFISQFNLLSYHLVGALLRETNSTVRMRLLANQALLLGECLSLNNFHFGMAIYSALNSRWLSLPSLKSLMGRLPKASVKAMENAAKQLGSARSYQELRRMLASLEGGSGRPMKSCVPHLGLAIQDISYIQDANTEWTTPHQYNYRRLLLLHTALVSALRFQAAPFAIEVQPEIQTALEEMFLQPIMEEDLNHLAKQDKAES